MPFSVPLLFVGAGLAIGALIDSSRERPDYRTIYLWQPRRGSVLKGADDKIPRLALLASTVDPPSC